VAVMASGGIVDRATFLAALTRAGG